VIRLNNHDKLPFSPIEPDTKDWVKCFKSKDLRLESPCGTFVNDELIVAWRAPNSEVPSLEKYFCFVVRENPIERAVVFEGGEIVDILYAHKAYKFKRTSGVSIVWVLEAPFDMDYGVPKSSNIKTSDGELLGFHGKLMLKVDNVEKFVRNVMGRNEKLTTYELREILLPRINNVLRPIISSVTKSEFMKTRTSEILNKIKAGLIIDFKELGITLENITISGFAPDC